MAAHVFVTSEENYRSCVRRGIAAIPQGSKPDVNDQLISRMALIRPGDSVLFYIAGEQSIHGVYKVIHEPFYDDSPVWNSDNGQIYPLRVRIDNSQHVFRTPLSLSDIYDLRDNGKIWTFNLHRPGGRPNAMFSISDGDFDEILQLLLKVNHVLNDPPPIQEPFRHVQSNLLERINWNHHGEPKYEATLAALFLRSLANGLHIDILGKYSDYLAYVTTSFQKEIDVLLFHSHPARRDVAVAYSIVELKREEFSEAGLSQLLRYEDWFLKKRANGDSRAIRTIAVAKSFSEDVVDYVRRRERIEGKSVALLRYRASNRTLAFEPLA